MFSPLLRFLIVAYVRKPFLARISEVSYPIPVELPVTTATLLLDEGEDSIYTQYRYTILLKRVSDL
jgi:hypothetical protein